MPRGWFTAIRVAIVVAGGAVILSLVQWQTTLVTAVGQAGLDGQIAQVEREQVVVSMEYLDSGYWRVETADGQRGVVDDADIRRSLPALLIEADLLWLLVGLALVGCVYPLQATRWWLLMRCRKIDSTWLRTLRLVLVGAFCNFFLPGTEGGDVVKAWGAAKGTDRRVEAVMSVVFDRITGLAGLVLVAAIAGIFLAESEQARNVGLWTGLGMVFVVIFGVAAFFIAERGWLRLPEVVRSFGGGLPGRAMDAARAYGRHPGAVVQATGVSMVVQVCLAAAAGCCAWAVGAELDLVVVLTIMPILFIAAAVPLFWQGAGVMELVGIMLLASPEVATSSQVIALLVLYRVLEFIWGLIGSLLMLGGGIQLHPSAPAPPESGS